MIGIRIGVRIRIVGVMNLSYGESLVAAAFGAFSLYSGLGLSPLAALLLAVPVAMLLNWLLYRFLLERLMRRGKDRGAQEIDSILVTFGILFVIQGAMPFRCAASRISASDEKWNRERALGWNALRRSTHHRPFASCLQCQIFAGNWRKFSKTLPGGENSSAGAAASSPARQTCNHGSTISRRPAK